MASITENRKLMVENMKKVRTQLSEGSGVDYDSIITKALKGKTLKVNFNGMGGKNDIVGKVISLKRGTYTMAGLDIEFKLSKDGIWNDEPVKAGEVVDDILGRGYSSIITKALKGQAVMYKSKTTNIEGKIISVNSDQYGTEVKIKLSKDGVFYDKSVKAGEVVEDDTNII